MIESRYFYVCATRWVAGLLLAAMACEPVQVGVSRGRDTRAGHSNSSAGAAADASHPELAGGATTTPSGGSNGSDSAGRYGVGAADGRVSSGGLTATSTFPSTVSGGGGSGGNTEGALPSQGSNAGTSSGVTGGASWANGGANSAGANLGGGSLASASQGGANQAGANSAGAGQAGDNSTSVKSCPGSGLSIHGRVLTPRGEPLAGVQLTLTEQSNLATTTDANGAYGFSDVCAGANVLTPSHANLEFCDGHVSFTNLSSSVEEDITGSAGGCVPAELTQRLAILVFDPLVEDGLGGIDRLSRVEKWSDPVDLAAQYRRTIESVTNGRVRYEVKRVQIINEFPQMTDGFQYTPETYSRCRKAPDTNCHVPDDVDYRSIALRQGLCDEINNGRVDEVWLFGGPNFGFSLLQRLGPPLLPWLKSVPDTDCIRRSNVFGFNYERGLEALLQGVQLEFDASLDVMYQVGTEDSTDNHDLFARVFQASPGAPAAGCGGYAYAPNSSALFEFDNRSRVPSYCDGFYDYPNVDLLATALESINCEAWGCTGVGYGRYWLRHLPAAKGTGKDGMLADWWRYLLRPEDAVATLTNSRTTCSSSYISGWCDKVRDGYSGECNDNEWATSNTPTGWVELSWPVPKAIASVVLYDRACTEQVLRGHLEFSDGSPWITFGTLEDLGKVGTTISFDTKQLTWMRVVIDESTGGANPGLGEISVP